MADFQADLFGGGIEYRTLVEAQAGRDLDENKATLVRLLIPAPLTESEWLTTSGLTPVEFRKAKRALEAEFLVRKVGRQLTTSKSWNPIWGLTMEKRNTVEKGHV